MADPALVDPGRRRDLPQGVVTFLFSDVEGSTRLLEKHGDAVGPALARHHEVVRHAIESHTGTVFETVGDAVYGAFVKPADALAAAVAVHRGLARERWGALGELRVRIAVHSGAVESRGAHYFGPALFECSRLQALAHGGQTVTSATTAELAVRDLPEDISLRPLGRHRLDDLANPMQVVQVDAAGLRAEFPPLRSAEATPSNLPHETTMFIGRSVDLARIADLVARERLVSLLGPGGTGKTRLALEVAAAQMERFPDGVWLVELAPISSAELVLTQLADVWGLRPGHNTSLEDVVRRYLAERQLLLVVDNCEHVREGAARVVRDVLRAAPGVSVLATSRESLGVPGEIEYRVATLALPTSDAEAEESDAVRLFVDRVRSVRPDQALSAADMAGIVRVCRRVEGMPLGLELAAARVRTLSPAELADRLDSSFLTVGTPSKSTVPRQRTLQATLDWSHDLLDETERTVFRRLAVFAGSFELTAAERVCESGDLGADVLDTLDSLVDKSLVLSIPGPVTRFRLLEPIRQYAQRQLEAAGEIDRLRAAHADHFAGFVAEAAPRTRGPEQIAWDRRIDAAYPDIRVALGHLLETDLERHLAVGFDLFVYWMHVGKHMEGIATLLSGLERAPASLDRDRQLRAWFVLAILLAQITKPEAIEHARRGLELARSTGDLNAVGRLELGLGAAIRHSTNDPEYLEHLLEARRLLDAHPEPHWWEPRWEHALLESILASYLPPDDGRSEAHFEEALAGFRAVGDQALYAAVLAETAGHWGRGNDEVLMGNLVEAIELLRPMRLPYWYSHAVLMHGTLLQMEGRVAEAAPSLAEAVDQLETIGDLSCWGFACRRLATATAELGGAAEAGRLLAKAIDSLPVLPMPEATVPRSLDAAAGILLDLGLEREAAIVLGRSRATTFSVETIVPRDAALDAVQDRLERHLGTTALEQLMAEGAAAEQDDILVRAAGWLRSA